MPDDPTKTHAEKTSAEEGKNTEGAAAGTGTQTAKTEAQTVKFTQADLDRVAGDARKEEREKLERKRKDEDQQRAEEEAKKQGKFEKLYTDLKPQYEAQGEELSRYKEQVKVLAKSELENLPDEVRDMAPSLEDPLSVLAWLPKGKKLAERLKGNAKPGHGPDPKPSGGPGVTPEDIKQRKRASGQYAF